MQDMMEDDFKKLFWEERIDTTVTGPGVVMRDLAGTVMCVATHAWQEMIIEENGCVAYQTISLEGDTTKVFWLGETLWVDRVVVGQHRIYEHKLDGLDENFPSEAEMHQVLQLPLEYFSEVTVRIRARLPELIVG